MKVCSGKSRSSREQESQRELETVTGQESVLQEEQESSVRLTGMEGQQKDACSSHPPGGAVYFEYWTV